MKGIISISLDIDLIQWLKRQGSVSEYINNLLRISAGKEGSNLILVERKIEQLILELQSLEKRRLKVLESMEEQALKEELEKVGEVRKKREEIEQRLKGIKEEYDKIPEIKILDKDTPLKDLLPIIDKIREKYPSLKYQISVTTFRDYWKV